MAEDIGPKTKYAIGTKESPSKILEILREELELTDCPEDMKRLSEIAGQMSRGEMRKVWKVDRRNGKVEMGGWFLGAAVGALVGYYYVSDITIVQEFGKWITDMLIKYNWIEQSPYISYSEIAREAVTPTVSAAGTGILGASLIEKLALGLYHVIFGRDEHNNAAQILDSVSLEAGSKARNYE